MTYQIVSLFSGAGGFDWGFHLSRKFMTRIANELKADPAQTLARNLNLRLVHAPFSPCLADEPVMVQGDVADVSFIRVNGFQPEVIIGGPPCQDFSIVKGSNRKGIEVKRGKLYAHFIRAVASLQPKIFVFENVPGLVSANNGWAYKIILEDFKSLSVRWQEIRASAQADSIESPVSYEIIFNSVINASHLGVPQSRRRLIIVGIRKDLVGGPARLQHLRDSFKEALCRKYPLLNKYPLTCIEVFEGRPLCELQGRYREIMQEYEGLCSHPSIAQAMLWRQRVWKRLTHEPVKDYLFMNEIIPADTAEIDSAMEEHARLLDELGYLGKPVGGLQLPDSSNLLADESDSVKRRMRYIPPGENHEFVRDTPWQVEGRGISLIYRRPFPLKPAPTVVAYGGGGTWGYHYERSRAQLTNRERARLQTFSDDFLFVGGVSSVRAQIGEAVPPLLGIRIAEAVAEIL